MLPREMRSEALKQFYSTAFLLFQGVVKGFLVHPVLHFFLDIPRKAPYKGDTSALHHGVAHY